MIKDDSWGDILFRMRTIRSDIYRLALVCHAGDVPALCVRLGAEIERLENLLVKQDEDRGRK